MNTQDNTNNTREVYKDFGFYNTFGKNEAALVQKTGNRELDKALADKKFNSMPNFVRAFATGVSF